MQTLLDRDKKENERNYEWKKEVYDRSCYSTQKKIVVCELWHTRDIYVSHIMNHVCSLDS